MKLRLATVCAATIILTGCASTLEDINGALRKVNGGQPATSAATKVPVGQLGNGRGYQPNLTASMPAGVCNQAAFLDGLKDTYAQNWQTFVDAKVATYRNLSQAKNADPAAKKNLSLYQSHSIGMSGYIGRAALNGPGNSCLYQSYIQGQQVGFDLYGRDSKALQGQETALR